MLLFLLDADLFSLLGVFYEFLRQSHIRDSLLLSLVVLVGVQLFLQFQDVRLLFLLLLLLIIIITAELAAGCRTCVEG